MQETKRNFFCKNTRLHVLKKKQKKNKEHFVFLKKEKVNENKKFIQKLFLNFKKFRCFEKKKKKKNVFKKVSLFLKQLIQI